MKSLTVILAGTLIATAGFTATASAARPGSLGVASRSHHGGHGPSGGGLSAVHRRAPPQISPHMGLPGISGFSTSPRISPHIGLPGISGFPVGDTSRRRRGHHGGHDRDFEFVDLGYWGDGDGYVDTIPTRDQFGFFATGGFVTHEPSGKPVYHYDRSYPYEFGSAPRAYGSRADADLQCRVQTVWDDVERQDVRVRVCTPA